MRTALVIGFGLAFASCYSPQLVCEVHCGSDSPCPSDLVCQMDHFCHEDGDDQMCTPTLTVTLSGGGQGHVTSFPAGVDCASGNVGTGCANIAFHVGTMITLTAMPFGPSHFGAWNGDACGGSMSTTCAFQLVTSMTVDAHFY